MTEGLKHQELYHLYIQISFKLVKLIKIVIILEGGCRVATAILSRCHHEAITPILMQLQGNDSVVPLRLNTFFC